MSMFAMRWRGLPPQKDEIGADKEWESSDAFNYYLVSIARTFPRSSFLRSLLDCPRIVVPPDLTSKLAAELDEVAALPDERFPRAGPGVLAEMRVELGLLRDFVRVARVDTKYVVLNVEPIE